VRRIIVVICRICWKVQVSTGKDAGKAGASSSSRAGGSSSSPNRSIGGRGANQYSSKIAPGGSSPGQKSSPGTSISPEQGNKRKFMSLPRTPNANRNLPLTTVGAVLPHIQLPGGSQRLPLQVAFISAQKKTGQSRLIAKLMKSTGNSGNGKPNGTLIDDDDYFPTVAVNMYYLGKAFFPSTISRKAAISDLPQSAQSATPAGHPQPSFLHLNLHDVPTWAGLFSEGSPFLNKHVIAFVFDSNKVDQLESEILVHSINRACYQCRTRNWRGGIDPATLGGGGLSMSGGVSNGAMYPGVGMPGGVNDPGGQMGQMGPGGQMGQMGPMGPSGSPFVSFILIGCNADADALLKSTPKSTPKGTPRKNSKDSNASATNYDFNKIPAYALRSRKLMNQDPGSESESETAAYTGDSSGQNFYGKSADSRFSRLESVLQACGLPFIVGSNKHPQFGQQVFNLIVESYFEGVKNPLLHNPYLFTDPSSTGIQGSAGVCSGITDIS
jgi:hypothetical protein